MVTLQMDLQRGEDCCACLDDAADPIGMIALELAGTEREPILLCNLVTTKPRDVDSFRLQIGLPIPPPRWILGSFGAELEQRV